MPQFKPVSPERMKALKDGQDEYLGSGCSRNVRAINRDYVLKHSPGYPYCNQQEWKFWQWAKENGQDRFLAPCLAISEDGEYLMQERVKCTLAQIPGWYGAGEGRRKYEQRYDELLRWASDHRIHDTHAGNIGLTYDDRLVMIDYAG